MNKAERWRDSAPKWLVGEYDRLVKAELTLREMEKEYGRPGREVYERALLGKGQEVDAEYPVFGVANMIARVGRQHYYKRSK